MTVRLILGLLAGMVLPANELELRRAFVGKQVILRIDMPGTQNGVDLHLDRDEPMDWKQYSQRSGISGMRRIRGGGGDWNPH